MLRTSSQPFSSKEEHQVSSFYRDDDGTLRVMAGSQIHRTIAEAKILSRTERTQSVTFDFNDVTVTVQPDSDQALVYRDWDRALHGYIDKQVGPHPNPVLTDEEKANDQRIKAENDRRWAREDARRQAKEAAKRERVEAQLADASPMEVADKAAWQSFKDKNPDGYGGAVITYSERWARLMQDEMDKGRTLEKVAEVTSREADLEGITGFQYGVAVSTLSQCWKHGDTLRRWHNLKTQIGNEGERANEEGGTLNPALLSIGSES